MLDTSGLMISVFLFLYLFIFFNKAVTQYFRKNVTRAEEDRDYIGNFFFSLKRKWVSW